jgi:hypothetical protein
MTTVEAVLSSNRKYALCGACGRPLCRRDRRDVDPAWNKRDYVHVLVWGPEWRLHPAGEQPAYLTRDASSRTRYDLGNAPVRGTPGPQGAPGYVSWTPAPLALCECGALNRADPKVLHVQAMP